MGDIGIKEIIDEENLEFVKKTIFDMLILGHERLKEKKKLNKPIPDTLFMMMVLKNVAGNILLNSSNKDADTFVQAFEYFTEDLAEFATNALTKLHKEKMN